MEFITIFEESTGIFKWRIMNGANVVDESAATFDSAELTEIDATYIYNLTIQ